MVGDSHFREHLQLIAKPSASPLTMIDPQPTLNPQFPTESDAVDYSQKLQGLMQQVGISSFRALSRAAEVSHWQVRQLRRGQALQIRGEYLLKLAAALQVSVADLLANFSPGGDRLLVESAASAEAPLPTTHSATDSPKAANFAELQREYEQLRLAMQQQRESVMLEFQQASLETLESWLRQWPTAARAAQKNPEVPATRLLPLLGPLEQLLQQWEVVPIAAVGSQVAYDPQHHQLMEGTAQPGDPVQVRYTGYRHGDRLLFRAQVSPLP
ncbi:helix-turn-helix domain-containing protein [Phormidium sp. CCY1219]|uniref:helix-turn-helix domain-containing protein n=1 Tax=Phormidium sp. CCY1219 TaxID=2886104 RepID=UPI002D1EB87B|nr:helix-turn-helix domain-containing protein [Phormidium sp. CCY1219]MEB3828255.1 helix-turn-helix domain-containing protein [Phormidium sp. CCY1219]